MNKILSVIVPTYNMENYLHKCLGSLLVSEKNRESLEVLVVNDGSKDSSSQIAHEYEDKYPQIFKVIDKENGNYGSCINRGLKEATGKYVKVLDADDCYVPETLDKFLEYLQYIDVDFIINDFLVMDEYGAVTETYTFDLPTDSLFTLCDIPSAMISWLWHHAITYRTSILQEIKYRQTEGISYTDDEWVFMPMIKVESVAYFPYVLYNYLYGREGQTFDPRVLISSFSQRVAVVKSMAEYYTWISDKMSAAQQYFMTEKLLRRTVVLYYFYLSREYSNEGNEVLKEFDLFIRQQVPDIYDMLGQYKDRITGYRIIKGWRESHYTSTWYLQGRRFLTKVGFLLGKSRRNLHMPEKLRRK